MNEKNIDVFDEILNDENLTDEMMNSLFFSDDSFEFGGPFGEGFELFAIGGKSNQSGTIGGDVNFG